jgi:hypothetical protein
LEIKDGIPHDRDSCENNVVHLIDPCFIDGLPGEYRQESKPILGQDKQNILIEDIADQEGISSIGFSTMYK